MPTSTEPFEVYFDFANDCNDVATLQAIRVADITSSSPGSPESHLPGGPAILLYPKENVSLVLDAGATYLYTVKQSTRKAQLSIRTWKDTKCSVSDVFSLARNGESASVPWTPLSQNVIVTLLPADV